MESRAPRLFYDGHCALCHRGVRFALARDRQLPPLRIAPIGGETFRRQLTVERRRELPDSVLVLTPEDDLLLRSEAVRYLLRRAGGVWSLVATLAGIVPRSLRDALYDAVARRRQRWFGRTEEACPSLPASLRQRFDP